MKWIPMLRIALRVRLRATPSAQDDMWGRKPSPVEKGDHEVVDEEIIPNRNLIHHNGQSRTPVPTVLMCLWYNIYNGGSAWGSPKRAKPSFGGSELAPALRSTSPFP